ncbi:hypothetical protein AMK59_3645 [Oryctes borbonicus]|uniref:Uncharacterized protein n=1 Tax=Oryctes borbonicus TaxID=1629725 RepID=A0A0T6B5P3_9SCAR|nr:hypothetical protein AMK59_3645 [Oryctes borbonicus]
MSRHLSYRQRITPTSENPYKATTVEYPLPHTYKLKNGNIPPDPRLTGSLYRNHQAYLEANDTCFSEETFSENQYDYYNDQDNGYQTSFKKDSRNTDYNSYSDESASTRLPYYESEEPYGLKRQSRNTPSDRSSRKTHFYKEDKAHAYSDPRRVYPNKDSGCEILFCDSGQHCYNEVGVVPASLPRSIPLSRGSDRPQSSQSSSVTSAVVHGCGGRCQTFENVCYYFLQVAFTMGILIGVPLSIAGAVLRKSAARNLQVLVYIGAMLALVSALLLSVQCNAKRNAKKRRKAHTKRPIVLEPIPPKPVSYQQQPLMGESQRGLPVTIIPMSASTSRHVEQTHMIEQPGVPWWRRKDLMQNR